MIIDCISDLHGHFPALEGGDLLIIAGDLTARDEEEQHFEFFQWLENQNYKRKIVIAGNHDNFIQKIKGIPTGALNIDYLCDSGTEFTYYDDRFPEEDEGFLPSGRRTLKIWGSPWTKTFPGMNPKCKAFTVDTEEELADKWALIPDDIDILITHSPSFGNFDITSGGLSVGSLSLWMMSLVIRPKLHVFGHIHEAYGQAKHHNGIHLVNASIVNENYEHINKPVRVVL